MSSADIVWFLVPDVSRTFLEHFAPETSSNWRADPLSCTALTSANEWNNLLNQ